MKKLFVSILTVMLATIHCINAHAGEKKKNHKARSESAIVFLIAGQSNAGGVAAFSRETNQKAGMQDKHPVNPGTTAKEVGIPITKDAYPHCYIWKPESGPFEQLTPEKNLQTCYLDPWRHGIELPMAMLLEKKYPDCKIYFIKHGPAGHNLHTQWKAGKGPDYRNFIVQYRGAMVDIRKCHDKVQVVGLYWDQGEADHYQKQAKNYEKNLRALFEALRKDTGIPELQIYVRKLGLFEQDADYKTIANAQIKLCREDDNAHLLNLDIGGSGEENKKAWGWSINNWHLSSKAYLELSKRIMKLDETAAPVLYVIPSSKDGADDLSFIRQAGVVTGNIKWNETVQSS